MTVQVRRLPRALASIVAALEFDQASVVTLRQIERLAAEHGISSKPADLAWRLRRDGWLLPTTQRGVWEFAPASHAGPYGRGDVFAVLRGELEKNPTANLRVALISALWLHGLAERPPSVHELSTAKELNVPVGLTRSYRVFRFDARLPPRTIQQLPVEEPATTLVHAAVRPSHVTSWDTFENALTDLVDRAESQAISEELLDRPATAKARLGYLLQAIAPDITNAVGLNEGTGVTWFGPRNRKIRRFDARWQVADTVLPFNPAEMRSR